LHSAQSAYPFTFWPPEAGHSLIALVKAAYYLIFCFIQKMPMLTPSCPTEAAGYNPCLELDLEGNLDED
jgi:hypothetical protein